MSDTATIEFLVSVPTGGKVPVHEADVALDGLADKLSGITLLASSHRVGGDITSLSVRVYAPGLLKSDLEVVGNSAGNHVLNGFTFDVIIHGKG